MNAATSPMGIASGKPTRTSPSEMSHPTATTGMEETISSGWKKRRKNVTEFHAWTAGCSPSQVESLSAGEAWVTSMEGEGARSSMLPSASVYVPVRKTSPFTLGSDTLYISRRRRWPGCRGAEKLTSTEASPLFIVTVFSGLSRVVPSRTVTLTEDSSVMTDPSGSLTLTAETCSPSPTSASQVTRVGSPPSTLPVPVSLLFAVVTSTDMAPARSGDTKVSTSESASAVTSACLSTGFRFAAI